MVAEPAAGVEDGRVAAVVEIGDHGAGQTPLLPAGQLAQTRFAGVQEGVMLAAGKRRDSHDRDSTGCWAACRTRR